VGGGSGSTYEEEIMGSTVIIILAMFTFLAVLAGAVYDLRNTDNVIRERRQGNASSAATRPQV
jgi:hypothetical protein